VGRLCALAGVCNWINLKSCGNKFIKILYLLCFEYFIRNYLDLFKAIEKCITPRSGNLFQPKGNALGKMYIIKNIAL